MEHQANRLAASLDSKEQEPFGESEYVIDYPLYLKFFTLHRRKSHQKLLSVLIYVIGSIGILLSLFSLSLCYDLGTLGMGIVFAAILVLKVFLDVYYPKYMYKNSKSLYESRHSIKLFTEVFTVEINGPATTGTSSTRYTALNSAYETKDMFFLYISKNMAYLVPKRDLPAGADSRLRSVLQAELGRNFRIMF